MRVPQHLAIPLSHADVESRIGHFWSGPQGLLTLGSIVLAMGVGLDWSWLAAAGITRIVIDLLPWAAMCALGLCIPRMSVSPATPVQPQPAKCVAPALSATGSEMLTCCQTSPEKENV